MDLQLGLVSALGPSGAGGNIPLKCVCGLFFSGRALQNISAVQKRQTSATHDGVIVSICTGTVFLVLLGAATRVLQDTAD